MVTYRKRQYAERRTEKHNNTNTPIITNMYTITLIAIIILVVTLILRKKKRNVLSTIEESQDDQVLYEAKRGIIPEIQSPIPLIEGEVCHSAVNAMRLVSKTITSGYSGGSRGFNVRLMKGVNYRIGNYKGVL